jgi:ribosomal protein S18 acetylase RimI-like enzyme
MMVTGTLERGRPLHGLQPFDLTRDLDQVADLLRLAFRAELGRRDAAWLSDVHTLGALKPVVWLLDQINVAIGPLGFVWFEDGELVRNVTLSRVSGQTWLISNMAVHPEYRRRGIGQALMEASVDWVRSRGAHWITLEVRDDNAAAKSLYQHLGFKVSQVTAEMKLRQMRLLPNHMWTAQGYSVRRAQPFDSRAIYTLACETTSALQQRLKPVRPADYQIRPRGALVTALRRLIGLPVTYWWIAEHDSDVVGAAKVRTSGYGHRLVLMVHPDHRGPIEEPLLAHALQRVPQGRGSVRAEVDATHKAAVAACRERGFSETRTLAQMVLELT